MDLNISCGKHISCDSDDTEGWQNARASYFSIPSALPFLFPSVHASETLVQSQVLPEDTSQCPRMAVACLAACRSASSVSYYCQGSAST
eukprot:scaffold18583_cov20-Tisochrysis_lutea.AAC.1